MLKPKKTIDKILGGGNPLISPFNFVFSDHALCCNCTSNDEKYMYFKFIDMCIPNFHPVIVLF